MKKWFVLSAMVALVVLVVGSCTVTISSGSKVSGTITLVNMVASNASVTVQQGSSVYGTSVTLSSGGTQSGTYSLYGVPFGTYTVYVTFSTGAPGYTPPANYYIDGSGPSPFVPSAVGTTWTETIVAVSVQGDTTVDTYLHF